jgi:hypothetical protein
LLIGVDDKEKRGSTKISGGIVPVKEAVAMKGWIEQSIVNHLVPNTLERDVVVVKCQEGDVVAVNIPPSRALVAVWDGASKIEYVKRSSHGKFYMNPDAAERHLMDGSRATRLAIEAALRRATNDQVTLVGGVWRSFPGHPSQSWKPAAVTIQLDPAEDWFALKISTGAGAQGCVRTAHVPYGLVREAWLDSERRLTLLLAVRLTYDGQGGDIGFEPIAG